MNIAFALPDFRGGGAENVIVTLANYYVSNGHSVYFFTNSCHGPRYSQLHQSIKVLTLKRKNKFLKSIEIKTLCKTNNINILIGTLGMAHVCSIAKIFLKDTFVIARLGNTVSVDLKKWSGLKKSCMYIYQFVILLSDRIVFQSQYMYDDYLKLMKLKKLSKGCVIYNPIDNDKIERCLSHHIDVGINKNDIISLGRIEFQKNYNLAIDVFHKFMKSNPKSNYYILGDGCDFQHIKKVVDEKEISDRVIFLGYKSNPYPYLCKAGVFLLTSRYEGFSNALLEASFLGIPCVVTDVPGGNREIIKHNVNGYLFDINKPYDGASFLEKSLSLNVQPEGMERYFIDKIALQYLNLSE